MTKRKVWLYVIPILIFVAYVAWMLGPYLRSVIVRDASVTAWSRMAVSPIHGRIMTALPEVGSRIGDRGLVATIRNDLLLQEARVVEDTQDRIIVSQARVGEATDYLTDLEALERGRVAAKDQHIEVFRDELETEIANIGREIAVNAERIAVVRRIADRQQDLLDGGVGSEANLDEAKLRVAELELRQAGLQAELDHALLRQNSAEQAVYIARDGAAPDWVREGELELKLEISRARHEIHAAQVALDEAVKDVSLEEATLQSLAEADVSAPAVSVVFNVIAAPAATVAAGDAIIEWIDCAELLVDVPVSDAELPLILRGMAAEIILEGESQKRTATVLLTRGSAASSCCSYCSLGFGFCTPCIANG